MTILFVALAGTLGGLLLILLLGGALGARRAERDPAAEGAGELAWVRAHGVEGFQRMLVALFAELGFNPERSERGSASVDLYAVDPTPIRGGRIYVHGVLGSPGVPVEAEDVRTLIDTARAESVGKAVLVTLERFSADARDAARDNPVDLLDGGELAALVRKHLPQAYATRTV